MNEKEKKGGMGWNICFWLSSNMNHKKFKWHKGATKPMVILFIFLYVNIVQLH
jgi:hypothetical protein